MSIVDLAFLDHDADAVTNLQVGVFTFMVDAGCIGDSDIRSDPAIFVEDRSRDVAARPNPNGQLSVPRGLAHFNKVGPHHNAVFDSHVVTDDRAKTDHAVFNRNVVANVTTISN